MKYLPRFVSIEARRSNDISDCQAASLHMEIQFVLHQLRIPWRLRLTMHAKPYYGNIETNNLKLKLRKLRALFQVLERKRRTERERPCANTRSLRLFRIPSGSFYPRFSLSFPSLFPFFFLSSLSFLTLTFSFIRSNATTMEEFASNFIDVKINLYTNERTLSTRISCNRWCRASKQNLLLRLNISNTRNILIESMILRFSDFYQLSNS